MLFELPTLIVYLLLIYMYDIIIKLYIIYVIICTTNMGVLLIQKIYDYNIVFLF
jgi:hypothetical protein